MAKTSPMSTQSQGPCRDGRAVAACLEPSPFRGQPPCSLVAFHKDYRAHFTLLTCCLVLTFLDGYCSSP